MLFRLDRKAMAPPQKGLFSVRVLVHCPSSLRNRYMCLDVRHELIFSTLYTSSDVAFNNKSDRWSHGPGFFGYLEIGVL